jgi:hypothetical protein
MGKVNSNNFKPSFPGDLRDKHLGRGGGKGTYIRFPGGEVWQKQ